jgi:hypothetical protein
MSKSETTEILADLKRKMEDLKNAIADDNDHHHCDHWPNGRWPMIYNLALRIDAIERGEADVKQS